MIVLQGKYAEAKVYVDIVDETAISQVINLLNQPYIKNSTIRMMPDIHAGVGCTIGTTMTISDKVCPNLVGVDIGCGMETVRIKETTVSFSDLDKVIRANIPSGYDIRSVPHKSAKEIDLTKLYCVDKVDIDRAYKSIGSLGGGNHFIEVDVDDNGRIYIVVHSGSRHLGVEIAKYYQNAAHLYLTKSGKHEVENLIKSMKMSGRANEIQNELRKLEPNKSSIPKELAYVERDVFDKYIHDMQIAQEFARINRKVMMDILLDNMGLHIEEQFTTIHNYIDTDNMILRKGSVSAQLGEKLIIPINMRDGSLICVGKGNKDWNFSAPHGAGRLMSRREAKERFTVDEFEKEMMCVYTTSVGANTLDECPMAYKEMNSILDNIEPTANVETIIRPVYNFKAG